ncbi:MAG: DNA-directed RNA polymerase subunit H [Thermoplasmata archaeon]
MAKYNVLHHEMVPEHHLVEKGNEERVLSELGIPKELLPKIIKSDPAVRALEEIHGPIEPGRIIEIVRKSPTAGISRYYRVVVREVSR